MQKIICNELTNNRKIKFSRNVWTGKSIITVDGQITDKKKGKRNTFLYYDEKEKMEYEISVLGNELKGIDLMFNDQRITILQKLKAYEYILALLPFYLVAIGGAIGGLLGALGGFSVATICRKTDNVFLKILYTIFILVIVTAVWYFIASIVLVLMEQ